MTFKNTIIPIVHVDLFMEICCLFTRFRHVTMLSESPWSDSHSVLNDDSGISGKSTPYNVIVVLIFSHLSSYHLCNLLPVPALEIGYAPPGKL